MFTRELVAAGHTARFTVTRAVQGWEIREERDSTVVPGGRRTGILRRPARRPRLRSTRRSP